MNYQYSIFINYFLLFIGFIITLMAQIYVSSSYKKYSNIKNKKNITGFDVAREILDKNNLNNIKILEIKGTMTDFYDPTRKVLKLSTEVYNESTIAACAIAAHECGHAIQDKEKYKMMTIRHVLVPFVNLCSKLGYIAIFIGIIAGLLDIAIIGIILLLAMLLFQLVTLPVEFNASKRALNELNKLKLVLPEEHGDAKKMLTSAALTYVASVLTTLLEILRLFLMAIGRDRD